LEKHAHNPAKHNYQEVNQENAAAAAQSQVFAAAHTDTQTAALQNERNDIEIMRRRLDASVLLIKALGGGWNTTKLPANP